MNPVMLQPGRQMNFPTRGDLTAQWKALLIWTGSVGVAFGFGRKIYAGAVKLWRLITTPKRMWMELVGAVKDLTMATQLSTGAMRKVEQRTAGIQRQLDTLFDESATAIFRCRVPDGEFSYCNTACQRLFALSYESMLGRGWTLRIHPDDSEQVWSHWQATVLNWHPYRARYRLLVNGVDVPVEVTVELVRCYDGEALYFIGRIIPLSPTPERRIA